MVNDPIADMLTRIRNAMMAGHATVVMPCSNIKIDIARILKEEGFLESYEVLEGDKPSQRALKLKIKYAGERRSRRPVMSGIVRVSRPGRKSHPRNEIPWVCRAWGVRLCPSEGVMTGHARQLGVGGEILCKVW